MSLDKINGFDITEYAPALHLGEPYLSQTSFPLSLKPSAESSETQTSTLPNLLSNIRSLSLNGQIRRLLDRHSAIYFSNVNLADANEFSQFVHAFGFVPHEDIGNPVRRTVLANNVATANEGPNTQPVYPHNEFGLSPHYPAYHPEFIKALEEKGVKYQLTYYNKPRDQVESPGNSVLQAYGHHVLDEDDTETARAKIEKEIRRLPTATWEWINQSPSENPLGDLRVWQVLPAIRPHTRTGQPAFFNNAVSRFLNAVDAQTLEPPHLNKEGKYQPPAFYGDGSLIDRKYFDAAVEVIGRTRALVTWKKGDVLLLDNHAVQHGREPWTGDRKLLASLWDDVK
ncbi:Clavaminate synthase-like protein [Periconia macrospinosa]|uniref:Clavaminate synthase-like protein n=1 Tax=Periconia macrospinosa TaxID=97972 RepID=A0A2V1D0Q0_9PLEO|nr:Clavaminate synthase-like protein [Periconia macrospinosa]